MASKGYESPVYFGGMILGEMVVGPGQMKQMSRFNASSKVRFPLVIFCLLFPAILFAQAGDGEEKNPAQEPEQSSPFKITKKSEFACAEVNEVVIGGLASHEITVDPKRVERCLLKKVGSRLHECKKLRIEKATADWYGVVTLETEDGPVKFWFEELGENAAETKRIMVFTWPDTDKKYVCAAFSSKR